MINYISLVAQFVYKDFLGCTLMDLIFHRDAMASAYLYNIFYLLLIDLPYFDATRTIVRLLIYQVCNTAEVRFP